MNFRPVVIVGTALILVVAGAFALLPFQAAEHRTTVDGATGTASVGNATAALDGPVDVYVEGPDWAAGAVSHFLVGDLRAAGVQAEQVTYLENADRPILAVRIVSLNASYWPVSPTATADWRFVYTTSGNETFIRQQLATSDGPVINSSEERFVVEGQYALRDDVRGIVSIPAYRSGIADRIAATTAETLQAAARSAEASASLRFRWTGGH